MLGESIDIRIVIVDHGPLLAPAIFLRPAVRKFAVVRSPGSFVLDGPVSGGGGPGADAGVRGGLVVDKA